MSKDNKQETTAKVDLGYYEHLCTLLSLDVQTCLEEGVTVHELERRKTIQEQDIYDRG